MERHSWSTHPGNVNGRLMVDRYCIVHYVIVEKVGIVIEQLGGCNIVE